MANSWEIALAFVLLWTVSIASTITIAPVASVVVIIGTSSEVSALRLISAGVFISLWVVVGSYSWSLPVNHWLLMGSLEESRPYCHGVTISAIVFVVSVCCGIVPVVVGVSLSCLLCDYRIICDGYADPQWTSIVLAA